ncbi:MAG: hypothetical protein WEB53_07765 [Akkermansiaceae bacterium]
MSARYNYIVTFIQSACPACPLNFLEHTMLILGEGSDFPFQVSVQSMSNNTNIDECFSKEKFLKIFPPTTDQIITVYPSDFGKFNLMFYRELNFLVMSLSFKNSQFSKNERKKLFDKISVYYSSIFSCIITSGEELELSDKFIFTALNSSFKDACNDLDLLEFARLNLLYPTA